jgi:hypothetical protein
MIFLCIRVSGSDLKVLDGLNLDLELGFEFLIF